MDGRSDSANRSDSVERPLVDAAWAQFELLAAGRKQRAHESSGTPRIPGYRILREIHRGGQGVVYQAWQESTNRKVAIKVLKQGPLADETELARFDREADVLTRLKHPHIVAIHDRGASGGHVFYVMDFIAGRPLDAHVQSAGLSVQEVLALFRKICDAVNAAHLRGVIHRDLKPSNIRMDEEGEPHILDFGLAKLTQDATSSARNMTLTGQFVGSLPWASPEQAEGPSDLLDIRTDVYSLGVILYQLLTRHFPYPVAGRMSDVIRNILLTEPARPTSLLPVLDRDVEVILLKCLAKDPDRRYQSAGELGRDIQRYLDGEPIEARRASSLYQFHQFARRNRALVTSMAAFIAILAGATAVSVVFALSEGRQRKAAERAQVRAEKAELEAETHAGELEQVVMFHEAQLSGIDAQTMGMRLRASLIDQARAVAESARLPSEEVDARVEALEKLVAGSNFTGIALEGLHDNVFRPALVAIEEQFAGQPLIKARLLQTLATTLQELGLLQAASGPQEEALAIRRLELGDAHADTLESINSMGFLLQSQGKLAEAEPFYREGLEKCQLVLGSEHPTTIIAISSIGFLLQDRGLFAEAEPYYSEALEKSRRVLGGEHRDTLKSINNLATLLWAQGRLLEAEPYFRESLEKRRRVLGEEHPGTAVAINNMGMLLQAQGKLTEAEPYCREALEKRRRILGDEHHDTLASANNVGLVLKNQGKLAEAEQYYRETLERRRRVLGEEHPDTLTSLGNMAALFQAQGRLADAERYCRETIEKRRRVLGEEHPHTITSINNMGILLHEQGRAAEVMELLATSEPAARKAFTGANAVRLGRFLSVLGCARTAAGEFNVAETNLTEAHAILHEAKSATERDRKDVLQCLVRLYDDRNTANPDQGYAEKLAEWRSKLEAVAPATTSKE